MFVINQSFLGAPFTSYRSGACNRQGALILAMFVFYVDDQDNVSINKFEQTWILTANIRATSVFK